MLSLKQSINSVNNFLSGIYDNLSDISKKLDNVFKELGKLNDDGAVAPIDCPEITVPSAKLLRHNSSLAYEDMLNGLLSTSRLINNWIPLYLERTLKNVF